VVCEGTKLAEGTRVRGRVAFVAARSQRYVTSSCWGRAGASAGARRLLPHGRGAAGVQVIGRGQTRRQVRGACTRSHGVCCRGATARRAVKSLGEGRRVGRRAAFRTASVAARSQRRVTSSRWGRAGASAVARRLLPHGRGAAGGQVVRRGQARRQVSGVCPRSHGVCCRGDTAPRESRRWAGADAAVATRRLWPRGPGVAGYEVFVGGLSRRRSRGVCYRGPGAAGGQVAGRGSPVLSCRRLKFGLLRSPCYTTASRDMSSNRTLVSSARRSNGGLRTIVTKDPLGATLFTGTSTRRVPGSMIVSCWLSWRSFERILWRSFASTRRCWLPCATTPVGSS